MAISSQVTLAHQQKEAYTTVLFNQRSGMLEVSHRFYIHDAEHALAKATDEDIDLTVDKESQQRFSDYLLSHFSLTVTDQLLDLSAIGFEVEGKYFWVYQEIAMPQNVNSLKVSMTALQEVWPSQVNHVNVEKGGSVFSARLGVSEVSKEINLNRATNE